MKNTHIVAYELFESWINGNKKDVIEKILSFKRAKAIAVSVQIYNRLRVYPAADSSYDSDLFLKAFEDRI